MLGYTTEEVIKLVNALEDVYSLSPIEFGEAIQMACDLLTGLVQEGRL